MTIKKSAKKSSAKSALKSRQTEARARGKSWDDAIADGSFRRSLAESSAEFKAKYPATIENIRTTVTEMFVLDPQEQFIVYAALAVVVEDIPLPLTKKQMTRARDVYNRLRDLVSKRVEGKAKT